MEQYGIAGQVTDDNIIQHIGWITKATGTHSECVILIAFHDNNGYTNGP